MCSVPLACHWRAIGDELPGEKQMTVDPTQVPGIFLKNRFSGLCVDGVGAVQSSEVSQLGF